MKRPKIAASINSVEVRDLTHEYDSNKTLFKNLNSHLPTDEIVFLDGGVGSGRSSLLKMMAALMVPNHGSIVINDQIISEMTFEEFLPMRLKIGYSFEYAGLLSNKSLRDNLLLPIHYHALVSSKEAAARADELCEYFGLTGVADARPSAVSGSQRKACVVARAFALDPEMVLLDEPFAGLSTVAINNLKNFIIEQRKNSSLKHIYLTCQNPRDVEGWATSRVFVEPTQISKISMLSTSKGAA